MWYIVTGIIKIFLTIDTKVLNNCYDIQLTDGSIVL